MNKQSEVTTDIFDLDELDEVLIDEYYDYAVGLCKEAANIVESSSYSNNNGNKNYTTKSCMTDLVTIVDGNVEKFIFEAIFLKYPTHKFIGEESSTDSFKLDHGTFTWILDPIDGTTNYVHGLPFYAVSLGLHYKKKIVIGIVLNVSTKDLYTAKINKGAFKNGKKLHVSSTENKNEILLMTEFGVFHDYESSKKKFDTLMAIFCENGSIHGVRSLGCASLNLCMVAEGRADAYYEWGLHCWDIAAGVLIVTEAGGHIYQYNGDDFDLMARNVLAVSSCSLKDNLIIYMPKINHIQRDDA